MVICKFYQQGNCRYGDRCRFEHVNYIANTGYSGQHGYGRPQYQQPQYQLQQQYQPRGPNQYRWQNANQSSQRFRFVSPQQNRQFMEQSIRHQPMQVTRFQHQQNYGYHHQQPQHQQPRMPGFSFTQRARELENVQKAQTGFSFNRTFQQIQQPQSFQQVPMMVQLPLANPIYGGVLRPMVNSMMQNTPFVAPRPQGFGMVPTSIINTPQGQIIPPSDVDSGIYSSMSSLSLEEVEQFKAEKFDYQAIPIEPPPKELCF